ncbi:MAG: PHP domain-containing protein [Candidatus Marinimicrobia bacterium]|jgi:predicted metal-dependent phosphoesterase TrpH|nr:PHP domain-containing protein [Candidatus Neomarinimicrobiota bacterium]MDD4961075.1 PHP domain-containing protein [Candidatus Neomarinimicrobiota bacterium]
MAIYFSKMRKDKEEPQQLIADLHIHSTASDGEYRPAQIAEFLEKRGIRVAALADHDSIAGLNEFRRSFKGFSVPGIELSVEYRDRGFHLLAYGFDPENHELRSQLREFQKIRYERILKICERLDDMGLPLQLPDEFQHFDEENTLGRPHIARALMAAGHVREFNEAFTRYIGDGKPAYVAKARMNFEDAMALIRRAGGIAILAHPGQYQPGVSFEMLTAIPVNGFEVYHPNHSKTYTRVLREYCLRNGMPYSGGSDFHDLRKNKANLLGCFGLKKYEWDNLRNYLETHCACPYSENC